jgi:hypothetical protein
VVVLLQLAKHVGASLLVWQGCDSVSASGIRQQEALLGAALLQILWMMINNCT